MTRKEAREYIIEHCNPHRETKTEWDDAMECAIKALAQPERKTGKWIPEFNGKFTGGAYWFSCSKCKRIVPEVRNGGWNFCPSCGADMRGKEG